MTRLSTLLWVAAAALICACGSDNETKKNATRSDAADAKTGNAGGSSAARGTKTGSAKTDDFDKCIADVNPMCSAHDMNTAELMETPCGALTMVPIPLTD